MSVNRLCGKKILFLCPKFFGYEILIQRKMEDMGAEVVYYDERAITSAWDRALLKISPNIFCSKSQIYYQKILDDVIDKHFDYILVVKCDMFPDSMIRKFKTAFPKAKFCLYFWDSICNMPGAKSKMALFDYVSSFDRNDCSEYQGMHFRPLFYGDNFACNNVPVEYRHDVAFCGTIHSDRYYILIQIEKQCQKLGKTFYKFYYLQSNFIYYFYKIFAKGFRFARKDEFSFEKKSQGELSEIENSSRVIVDIQHPNQTGLTMRTIEMLGLKKKFITTNADIKNYDFYHPDNICVIDRNNPVLDVEFMNVPYRDINPVIYKKYSLEQWILDVLGISEEK